MVIENHIFTRGYATRQNIAFYDHSWNKLLSYTNIQQISSIYFSRKKEIFFWVCIRHRGEFRQDDFSPFWIRANSRSRWTMQTANLAFWKQLHVRCDNVIKYQHFRGSTWTLSVPVSFKWLWRSIVIFCTSHRFAPSHVKHIQFLLPTTLGQI